MILGVVEIVIPYGEPFFLAASLALERAGAAAYCNFIYFYIKQTISLSNIKLDTFLFHLNFKCTLLTSINRCVFDSR